MNNKMIIAIVTCLAFVLSLSAVNPVTGQVDQTKVDVNAGGSFLDPGYVYFPGEVVTNNQPLGYKLTGNGEPAYIETHTYAGSSPTSRTTYLPPNYKNPVYIGSNVMEESLFSTTSATDPETTAGFMRVGHVMPTEAERDALSNYTYYKWHRNYYPWSDYLQNNENATQGASVDLEVVQNNATLKLDRWSRFMINESFPIVLSFEASIGLYVAYFAQYFGESNYRIFDSDGKFYDSGSLSGEGTDYETFFISELPEDSNILYIGIHADKFTELDVRVSELSTSGDKLTLGEIKKDSFDLEFSKFKQSVDSFAALESTEFVVYQFEVPEALNNKFFTFSFESMTSSMGSLTASIFSDQQKSTSTNVPILGVTGEKWTVVFQVWDLVAWSYVLKVHETSPPVYNLGEEVGFIFPDEQHPTYYLDVLIPETGLYHMFFESYLLNQQSGGSDAYVNVNVRNENSTYYTGFNDHYLNRMVYMEAGRYTFSFYSSSYDDFNLRFLLEQLSLTTTGGATGVGVIKGGLWNFASPDEANTYGIQVNMTSDEATGDFDIYVLNGQAQVITTKLQTIASDGGYEFNVTSGAWLNDLYVFILATSITDLAGTARDALQVRVSITEYSGASDVPVEKAQLTATPTSDGTYSFDVGADPLVTEELTVNLEDLPTETWVRVEIDIFDVSLDNWLSFVQYPTINTYTQFISLAEISAKIIPDGFTYMFGFGSMNSTAQLIFDYTQDASEGSIVVRVLPQDTAKVDLGFPGLGEEAPSADGAPNVKGAGGGELPIPGFLALPFLATAVIMAGYKIRRR